MSDEFSERALSALASVKHIRREEIQLESTLEDLGFDSLDKITMLFELEKKFQISIPDEHLSSIRTVRDVLEGVGRLVETARIASGTANVT